jgi:hypothetical protein
MKSPSLVALWLSFAIIAASSLLYFPKWKMQGTEATISWDVSGYYMYLPAAIIYHDMKDLAWWDGIAAKYNPGPGMGQAFKHPSGNYVMKYPMGQALQFLPWFLTAHALAEPLGYPADGFSRPYQMAVSWGGLIIAFLGLWFLRRILRQYFSEQVTAFTIISVAVGSNYLEYAGVTGAMTHNWLFTLNCMLIWLSIQFYDKPSWWRAAVIGLLTGWAVITRPTEIVSVLIPLLWGVSSLASVRARVQLLRVHAGKLVVAAAATGFMVFLQMAYWKFSAGEWIVYSYENQGFTWFPPHIESVLWSARAGWLVYSPMMILAVIGLFMLPRKIPEVAPVVILYCLTALYITSAWDIWWYGGSLGQRAMVQAYPLWVFALGAFWSWAAQPGWRAWLFSGLALIFIYLNIWWSHQAHRGGHFFPEQMTRHYVWKSMGRTHIERDWLKLLDNRDEFSGAERPLLKRVLSEDFEQDTTVASSGENPISGSKSLIINGKNQFSPSFRLPKPGTEYHWIRAGVTFRCEPKEWDWWAMTQFVVRFRDGDKVVKERMIRLQRHVDGSEPKQIWLDAAIPDKPYSEIEIFFWNAGSNKTVRLDDLYAEIF